MVKIGVMQPYFFPYIGYWQLMNEVDKYVIFDDVNYIKRGWINRNRILINKDAAFVNLPLIGVSQNKLINETQLNSDKKEFDRVLKTIHMAYAKAPYYNDIYPIIESILNYDERNLALYLEHLIKTVASYLDIKTEFWLSSEITKNNELKGQDKIIDICHRLKGNYYINAIGGKELYSHDRFSKENLKLSFLKTNITEYKQYDNDFVPGLSIIDVMMFNSKEECIMLLNSFELED